MLIERYNKELKCHECFNDKRKWAAFTGYGDTAEKARISFFSINPFKKPHGLINFEQTV